LFHLYRGTNNGDMCNTNSNKTVRCWLVAADHSHQDIELPDGESVAVGRSPCTNITDTQVSRQHGEL